MAVMKPKKILLSLLIFSPAFLLYPQISKAVNPAYMKIVGQSLGEIANPFVRWYHRHGPWAGQKD